MREVACELLVMRGLVLVGPTERWADHIDVKHHVSLPVSATWPQLATGSHSSKLVPAGCHWHFVPSVVPRCLNFSIFAVDYIGKSGDLRRLDRYTC
jgi:hypothetical protein